MFDLFSQKSMNQRVLNRESHKMILLVPRPFMYVMTHEISQLSSGMTPLEQSFMFSNVSFPYPIQVTKQDANGEPLLRINGVLILPSFEMTLHLYHIETTERLDSEMLVSVPLIPGIPITNGVDISGVIYKIREMLPLYGVDFEIQKRSN